MRDQRQPAPHLHRPASARRPGDAGPIFYAALREDRLLFLIAVHGTDGHHALLSRAEIDPDCGRAPVLLASPLDDAPLDRAVAQLVLPRDRCAARFISGIDAICVDGGRTAWT